MQKRTLSRAGFAQIALQRAAHRAFCVVGDESPVNRVDRRLRISNLARHDRIAVCGDGHDPILATSAKNGSRHCQCLGERLFCIARPISLASPCHASQRMAPTATPRVAARSDAGADGVAMSSRRQQSLDKSCCHSRVVTKSSDLFSGGSKSGLRWRVRSRACSRRQRSMWAWLPLSRMSGIFQPRNSGGRV